MTKINDLWLYDQAEQEVAKIDSRLKSTPNRARLNKLHSFLRAAVRRNKYFQADRRTRCAHRKAVSPMSRA